MDLDEIRNEISEIDHQIIEFLSQRFSLVPYINEYKKENNISIFQPEREKQMYKKYWKLAIEKNINPDIIQQLYEIIIGESRRLQKKGFEL